MAQLQSVKLGAFEVIQSELIVSDPCHTPDIWCVGIISNAKPGIWEAEICLYKQGSRDETVACLAVFHQQCPPKGYLTIREELFWVGVDSGQAGVFDKLFYRAGTGSGQALGQEAQEAWYQQCCRQTLSRAAGVIPHGAVSSSGHGDGFYSCYTCRTRETKDTYTTWGVIIDFDVTSQDTIRKLLLQ